MRTNDNENILNDYLNARVTINYGGAAVGLSESGTLTKFSAEWIEITKEKGERFLIPISMVRNIKMVEPARLRGDSGNLLRPAMFSKGDNER